ncbi:hypothetical protein IQ241_14740 [Romeria aff. gracilis LEGE 07310]|uniref:TonB family protein n=1 Tax=Vasconcelosia minhoensis LEGE 07310 TaxID=915328 RepID=A0A8J7AYE2_9CYAN|nr:hypothetical protein [Romeria gracilis]MBE9078537.1 hypothetical protein [Romeria aff. gracilis LEGE 07310]
MKFIDLLRPMLLLSVGLHVLLLLLPLGRADETVPATDDGAAPEPELFAAAESEDIEETTETELETPPPAAPPPATVAGQPRQSPRTVAAAMPRRQPAAQTTPPQTAQPEAAATAEGSVPDLSTPVSAPDPSPSPAPQARASEPAPPDPEASAAPEQQAYVTPKVPKALEELLAYFTQALSYDSENTSDEATQTAQADWREASRAALEVDQLNVQTLEPPVRLSYPIENPQEIRRSLQACLPQTPHTAEVGVLFDDTGKATPTLLGSTGYSALDKEALALVTARMNRLENPEARAYLVKVEVRYDRESCASLAELAPPASDQSESRIRPQ